MTPGGRGVLVALAVALSVGFVVLAHVALAGRAPPALGAAVSLVPIALVLLIFARRGRLRLALAGFAAVAALALWLGWDELERHFPDLLFLEHAGMNLALGILFGRTLAPGREPLVAYFARVTHGGYIEPRVERYARRVTMAWTLFFAALFSVSCALYLAGLPAAWSFFANILSPVLIVAMFVVEYAVRLRALPGHRQVGILGGVRAFARHVQAARAQAPR